MSEVLSQSQIDALLSSMAGGGDASKSGSEKKQEIQYRKYDFYSPRKFTKDKLKLLRSIYDNYSRICSSQMNSLFRTTSDMEVIAVEEQRYYEFNNALTDTDILTLVKVGLPEQPKNLPMLLHISPNLMVNMIDRMMGGAGDDDTLDSGYVYTDIENVLYRKIMVYFVNIIRDAWSGYIRMDAGMERVEKDPSMFRDISVDETVVIVVLNVEMGRVSGKVNVCIPGTLLSDIFITIDRRKNIDFQEDRNLEGSRREILRNIKESALDVTAHLGTVQVNLDDIYNLHVGDVIDMSKPKDSQVALYIEGRPRFTGNLGVHKRNMAVKIDKRVEEENEVI